MTGIVWCRELIARKRGAIWIMVGRPRKLGRRKPSGGISKSTKDSLRYLDGVLDNPKAVYVMESSPLVKVGISNNPIDRNRGIQTSNGQIVRLVWRCWMDGVGATQIEKQFHRMHRGDVSHSHGEWYYMTPEEAIARLEGLIRKLGVYSIHPGWNSEIERVVKVAG